MVCPRGEMAHARRLRKLVAAPVRGYTMSRPEQGGRVIARSSSRVHLPDEAATAALGARLARVVRARDVVALWGALGAGKTALARAVIQALPLPDGTPAAEAVPSPSFTLVQIYDRRPASVWHIDLYRIGEPDEVIELGWDEALATGIVLVEWPDRAGRLLPGRRLDIELADAAGGGRVATLTDRGGWDERLTEVAGDA